MTILLDIFEPEQIERLIAQTTQVSRVPLNNNGYADYQWVDCLGFTNQLERKQAGELLAGIDQVEEQLSREMVKAQRNYLLYEGMIEPLGGLKQCCQAWRRAKRGNVMVPGRSYNVSYTGLMAWFDQLDRAGITVINTLDYIGTAHTLVALYQNSQKKEHTTLRRYIKDKIAHKDINPHVYNLMALKGAELGEARATALIDRYGTFWYTIGRDAEEIAETLVGEKQLGLSVAHKLLHSIGRE